MGGRGVNLQPRGDVGTNIKGSFDNDLKLSIELFIRRRNSIQCQPCSVTTCPARIGKYRAGS